MKGGKALLALASVVGMSMASIAMAEEAPYATFDIRLENNPVQAQVEPVLTAPVTKGNVAFRIINNTGRAAYFVNGQNQEYIPVVSENTVIAPYSTSTYKVVNASGDVVASWRLSSDSSQKSGVTSASKERFAQWGNQIQQVLEASRNRTVAYASKSEPTYYEHQTKHQSAVQKNTVVRGFW